MARISTILLVAVSFAVSALLVEAGIRIYRIYNPYFLEISWEDGYKPSDIPNLIFEPRANFEDVGENRWNKGVKCYYNSLGFRGSEEEAKLLRAVPSNGSLNIICTGDSYTVGKSVEYRNTFPKVVERIINNYGIKCNVFNFGVGGYNAEQEYMVVKTKIIERNLKPAIVIWQFLLNDIYKYERIPKTYSDYLMNYLHRYLYTKRLLSLTKKIILSRTPSVNIKKYEDLRESILVDYRKPENIKFLEHYLTAASSELKKHNITGVFLYVPYHEMFTGWQEYSEEFELLDRRIISLARACGWDHTINTYEAERAFAFEEIILDKQLNHHPNTKGYEIIGRVIADYLKDKILPKIPNN